MDETAEGFLKGQGTEVVESGLPAGRINESLFRKSGLSIPPEQTEAKVNGVDND
jgi:hypothetical protein